MKYQTDCVFYDGLNARLRPYCHKLQREVRPKDCNTTCGWYRMSSTDTDRTTIVQFGELTVEDVRRIMKHGLEDEL